MHKNIAIALAVIATSLSLSAQAADTDKAAGATITRPEAKDMKVQSEGQYKARQKVAEANEDLNKADCKSALDGAAKRACEKSAKSAAKSQKADAKMVHETEESAIKDAKKK